jgi:hypothetical protein
MFGKVRDMSYVPAGLMGFSLESAKAVWESSRPIRKWPESHRALDRRPGKNDLVVVKEDGAVVLKVDYYEVAKWDETGVVLYPVRSDKHLEVFCHLVGWTNAMYERTNGLYLLTLGRWINQRTHVLPWVPSQSRVRVYRNVPFVSIVRHGEGGNATYEVSPTAHILKAQERLPSSEHSRPWTSAHAIVKHLTQVIKRQLTLLTEIDTRSALSIILQGRIEFIDCVQRHFPTTFFPSTTYRFFRAEMRLPFDMRQVCEAGFRLGLLMLDGKIPSVLGDISTAQALRESLLSDPSFAEHVIRSAEEYALSDGVVPNIIVGAMLLSDYSYVKGWSVTGILEQALNYGITPDLSGISPQVSEWVGKMGVYSVVNGWLDDSSAVRRIVSKLFDFGPYSYSLVPMWVKGQRVLVSSGEEIAAYM